MDLTGENFSAVNFVLIALPGLVYAAVRRWARGENPEDRDIGLAIARGAIFAIALSCIYAVLFGNVATNIISSGGVGADRVRELAAILLVFYIVFPGLLAATLNAKHLEFDKFSDTRRLRYPRSKYGYSTTPSAWDHALTEHTSSWVKIRKADGSWVGGWFTRGSFASTYPETPSIYIDQQYELSSDGNFGAQIIGTGVYLKITEDDIVIWTRNSTESETGPQSAR